MPQVGPMTMWVNSTTRRPLSGCGAVDGVSLDGVAWVFMVSFVKWPGMHPPAALMASGQKAGAGQPRTVNLGATCGPGTACAAHPGAEAAATLAT
jgi:hypothetical protein